MVYTVGVVDIQKEVEDKVKKIAKNRLLEYRASLEEYMNLREDLFEGLRDKPFFRESKIDAIIAVLTNFARMFRDIFRFARSKHPLVDDWLRESSLKVKVIARKELLKDRRFKEILRKNKGSIRDLLDNEVFREVNCSHLLMVEGITLTQLHFLIKKLGYNPAVFLSDPRREDLRFAVDNRLLDKNHPFKEKIEKLFLSDELMDREISYWQPFAPEILKRIPGPKKWHKSRTHGHVYKARYKKKNILFIPVHIDPKNAVLAIAEIFGWKNKDDKSALHYHQTAAGKGKSYVGTGLYNLGAAVFLKLLRTIDGQGMVQEINIEGIEKLETTHSILVDNLIADEMEKIMLSHPIEYLDRLK